MFLSALNILEVKSFIMVIMPKSDLKNVDVVILAGGLGTRLQNILPNQQKVIAEVSGKPFLIYLLEWLQSYQAQRLILALGYHSKEVLKTLQTCQNTFKNIEIIPSIETLPLGTAGAIRNAYSHLKTEHILVLNGDSFIRMNLSRLIDKHYSFQSQLTLGLTRVPDVSRYGEVKTDPKGRITDFIEKSPDKHHSGKINAGVYVFRRSTIENIPLRKTISLEKEVFPQLVNEQKVMSITFEEKFIDIGTPSSYKQSQQFFT